MINTLEQLVELMRGQTIINGNKRQMKFKFKYWIHIVRANKEGSNYISCPNHLKCIEKSGTISDMSKNIV
jgi:hypothetical protein